MQSNNPFYQLLFFDPPSQTLLSNLPFPTQPLRHYPDPNLQIQNLPNLESRFPIKNSNDFTVEVFENNGEKKKYTLEELAKIVPDDFFEGLLERKIENGKLKIISDKAIDESYSNKILIRTGVDSFAVIPKYLIEKAREEEVERLKMEEEKILRIEQAKKDELASISNQRIWGGGSKFYQDPSLYPTDDEGNSDSSYSKPEGTISEPGGTIKISNNSQSNDQGPITVKVNNPNNVR
jgi:hypothetical protein